MTTTLEPPPTPTPSAPPERTSRIVAWRLPVLAGLLALVGTFVVGGILLVIAGANPFLAYRDLVKGAFGSRRAIEQVLVATVPLLVIALGLCFAYRAKVWNIGAEGQFLAGALTAAAVALHVSVGSRWLLTPLVLIAGTLGGAVIGWLIGELRARWAVNEILTSLLLNYVLFYVVTWAVRKPLHTPRNPLPSTDALPSAAMLPSLGSTSVHAGLIVALALVPITAYVLNRTPLGFRITMLGLNPGTSEGVGVNTRRLIVSTMMISAGLAGLAGAIQLIGPAGYLDNQISAGFGYTAIVVAMLGRLRAFGVMLAALFLAALAVGGEFMERTQQIPAAITLVIGAVFVLFVLLAGKLGSRS